MTLFTARPEFQPSWQSYGHQTQVALTRLTKGQITEMMQRKAQVDDIWDQMKASDRLPGVEDIRLPGERLAAVTAERLAQGIPIPEALRNRLFTPVPFSIRACGQSATRRAVHERHPQRA